jgi:hypothetical protein
MQTWLRWRIDLLVGRKAWGDLNMAMNLYYENDTFQTIKVSGIIQSFLRFLPSLFPGVRRFFSHLRKCFLTNSSLLWAVLQSFLTVGLLVPPHIVYSYRMGFSQLCEIQIIRNLAETFRSISCFFSTLYYNF